MERNELAQIIFRMATRESWNLSRHVGRIFINELNEELERSLTREEIISLLNDFYPQYNVVSVDENLLLLDLKERLRVPKKNVTVT